MIDRGRAWFAGRSIREQRLILVMLALLGVVVMWAGVIRPVRDGLSGTRARYADAVVRLAQTEAAVEAVETARRDPPPALVQSLADTVRQRADAAGFTVGSLDMEGADRVRLSIPSARPAVLIGWVNELERMGVLVETLTVSGNPDRTVGAQMTLRTRAR